MSSQDGDIFAVDPLTAQAIAGDHRAGIRLRRDFSETGRSSYSCAVPDRLWQAGLWPDADGRQGRRYGRPGADPGRCLASTGRIGHPMDSRSPSSPGAGRQWTRDRRRQCRRQRDGSSTSAGLPTARPGCLRTVRRSSSEVNSSGDDPPSGIFAVRPDGTHFTPISDQPATDDGDFQSIAVSPDGTPVPYQATMATRGLVPGSHPDDRDRASIGSCRTGRRANSAGSSRRTAA